MAILSYTTTRPWEDDDMNSVPPISESTLKALIMLKDTTIFGACLGFIYGISLLIVIMITHLAGLSPSRRDKINNYAPVFLTVPFWGGVFVMSSEYTADTVLAPLRLPFMEAVFWSMIAWATFISGFTIIATLVCLTCCSRSKVTAHDTCHDDSVSFCIHEQKHGEEATPLTLEEALAITAPAIPPSVQSQILSISRSSSPSSSRPRMGSVTRCWH